jgi:hypothetical protein
MLLLRCFSHIQACRDLYGEHEIWEGGFGVRRNNSPTPKRYFPKQHTCPGIAFPYGNRVFYLYPV